MSCQHVMKLYTPIASHLCSALSVLPIAQFTLYRKSNRFVTNAPLYYTGNVMVDYLGPSAVIACTQYNVWLLIGSIIGICRPTRGSFSCTYNNKLTSAHHNTTGNTSDRKNPIADQSSLLQGADIQYCRLLNYNGTLRFPISLCIEFPQDMGCPFPIFDTLTM